MGFILLASYPFTAQLLLSGLAFFLVAFGQPAWFPWNGLIAAIIGYALFFRVLVDIDSKKYRFWLGFSWFFCVQLVQMSWFLAHPFLYIYGVYFFITTWLGAQFGCIALLIRSDVFRSPSLGRAVWQSLLIASVWTVFEWSRLFLLSGLSWNPVGLALTSSIYALQMASLWGVFGLSFWVMFVNGLALYAWLNFKKKFTPIIIWGVAAAIPYLYGMVQLEFHKGNTPSKYLTAMLVQTAFPPEEMEDRPKGKGIVRSVIDEWRQIIEIMKSHRDEKVDLIVLPEFVVPFGTFSFIYPLDEVIAVFQEALPLQDLKFLPSPDYPFVAMQNTFHGPALFANNAYWVQALSNYFQSDIIVGLEDAEEVSEGVIEYYSSAQFTHPQNTHSPETLFAKRYAKQVLVPMGEYIPFSFCKKLAKRYGICGSFTHGKEAVIMNCRGVPFSPSICYEETFGHLMTEGRQKGADLFVNLTSDVWYPNSKLPRQHLDHARLRTVENGVPLIRSCNTGITVALDSFGRSIAILGGECPEKVEWEPNALVVDVPIYSYQTFYSQFGDKIVIFISLFLIGMFFILRYLV